MEYPMNSVIAALQQGVTMGQRLRQAQMNEDLLKQKMADMETARQMQDLVNRNNFAMLTRPVDELGMVTDKTDQGPSIGGIAAPSFDFQRKAKAPITYKSTTGETLKGEILSPEEQWVRQAERARMMQEAQNIELPGVGTVSPKAIPYLSNLERLRQQAAEGALNRENRLTVVDRQQGGAKERAEAATTSRENVARENREAANKRAEAANKTRVQIHNTPSPTSGQTQNRFEQRRMDLKVKQLQAEHDKLDAQEQKQHADAVELGTRQAPNSEAQESRKKLIESAQRRAEDLNVEKQKKLAEIDKLMGRQPRAVTRPNFRKAATQQRIRVQLQDGRTGSVDASEFDEKTMKKL